MSTSKDAEPQGGVSATLTDAYGKVSEKVVTAYSAARERATDAAQITASGIEANPLAALAGGLAIGLVAAALLPRTEREHTLLAPLGGRVADAAKAALEAAKTAGSGALDEAGLSQDKLRGQASNLIEQLIAVAGAAGNAALEAARGAGGKQVQ